MSVPMAIERVRRGSRVVGRVRLNGVEGLVFVEPERQGRLAPDRWIWFPVEDTPAYIAALSAAWERWQQSQEEAS